VTGVDFASAAIERARSRTASRSERLSFQEADMDQLELPDGSFDTIIEIDSLPFADDLEATLSGLRRILASGGQLALLHSQMIPGGPEAATPEAGSTRVAELLGKLGLAWEAWGYTENEKAWWLELQQGAEELKSGFEQEGNQDLYVDLVSQAERILGFFESHRRCRFLFHARKE
jgi:ubiquinone/menaquinone biosynthesis C-methylase UbiE